MDFQIDSDIQSLLESACVKILHSPEALGGWRDIRTKSPGDVLIEADVHCDGVYADTAQREGIAYHSEETRGDFSVWESGDIFIIADPIDGSSEFGRYGPRRSPIMTAALALRGTTVVAGAVGDLWNEAVYGLEDEGLYVYQLRTGHPDRRTIRLSEARRATSLGNAAVAAYAPTHTLMRLIYPGLFEHAQVVANNAGIGTQLAVVEMDASHSLCASIETKPIDLFEHIGAIMAAHAGAYVCRLDGSELLADPRHLQSGITAVSAQLAGEIWESVRDQYVAAGIPHDVLIDTPEGRLFQKG